MELCMRTMIRKILNFDSYYYTNSFKIVKKKELKNYKKKWANFFFKLFNCKKRNRMMEIKLGKFHTYHSKRY